MTKSSRVHFLVVLATILVMNSCSSPQPVEPTTTDLATASFYQNPTATPTRAIATQVETTPPSTQMRAYAPDAANLLNLVDLSQSQSLSSGTTVQGRITTENLAVPYTYDAQAGDVLLIELLLPNLPVKDMQKIFPAIFIADDSGNEVGYMHGGQDYVTLTETRSIAQAGFVVPASGQYTILATLDGHQDPKKNPLYEADFSLTATTVSLLDVNTAYEEARESTERRIYAFQTAVGEFNLNYEEVSGDPPGPYAINVYRVGSPVDGIGLGTITAASYPFNFSLPVQDNAYASIAETMGLEKLTYIISIASSIDPNQPQTNYTSHFRITVQQGTDGTATEIATPVPKAPSNPDDVTWKTHLSHTMHVQFQIPDDWEISSDDVGYYGRGSASLKLIPENDSYLDVATACQEMTQGVAALAFGIGTGEVVKVNGLDACVLSRPETEEPYRAFIKYPHPLEITRSVGPRGTWNFLRIDIEPSDYFWPIVNSISIPDEPSAELYVSGVLDVLKSVYYFRDQMNWLQLEDVLNARLNEQSTREDAYDALRWLVQEMTATVNHDHMGLRTPKQVQDAMKGKQDQVGLQLVGNVVSLVYPNSPAESAGMQLGDKIITVNGTPFAQANVYGDSFNLVVERDGRQFETTLVPQKISYILPPRSQRFGNVSYLETFGIFGADLSLLQDYTANVQTAIKGLDSANTCGWILDLRRNTGGSIHAIQGGIAPFVGDGELYHIRWPDGHEDVTYYENGRVFGIGTSELPAMVQNPYTLSKPNPPMTVLVSHSTASGGEVSTVVVSGRPDSQTRIFGEQTSGLTTVVTYINLYDGGMFWAPIQLLVDLNGQTHLEGVIPDESLPVVYDQNYGTQDDPVVQAALNWLKTDYGCTP